VAEGDCGAFLCSDGVAKPSFPFLFVFVCAPFQTRFEPKQSPMNRRNLNICILTRNTKRKREKKANRRKQKVTSSRGYGIWHEREYYFSSIRCLRSDYFLFCLCFTCLPVSFRRHGLNFGITPGLVYLLLFIRD